MTKELKVDEIRELYLNFFKKKQHVLVASDSLVPQNDPTLLFTGAGMNQFKDNFLGLKKDLKRAASSQKCLRTGDLENVGRTAFHHSFFEMLGNFSFGDYFKKEAIEWAWEFLTVELKIPASRLRVSVHKTDDEAFGFWEKIVGKDKIDRLGDKDNFWPSNAPKDGPNGPCGPCSEIYFDQNPNGTPDRTVEHKDFAEIWNLVFTQYDRQDGGKLVPLAQKNIDTGMGLERLSCVLQGKTTNFEIDTFQPINSKIEDLLLGVGTGWRVLGPNRSNLYAISDHVRAVTFCIADGVIPSNEGRGYVIRKLIRKAMWRAHQIKPMQELEPFLHQVVHTVAEVMAKPYPEIKESAVSIAATIKGEEERFLTTFETGNRLLAGKLANLKNKTLPGEIVFELYDTYGFPDELTGAIAEEKGFTIDQVGFDKAMAEQRKRAKDSSKMKGDIFATGDLEKSLSAIPETKFLGYNALEAQGKILLASIKDRKGVMVLDQSPFYAESGGQVGDHGILKSASFEARVTDTQKKDKHFLHMVEITKGAPKTGEMVTAKVDTERRARTMRNHTATHLLHAALRNILGPQVRQLGSLVAPDKLRFDYSYAQALTAEQIKQLEDSVNAEILADKHLTKEEKATEEAKKEGALAFFGEKYGDKVRVVTVPGYSKEFCGGTHCDSTGQIGFLVITSDSSIASGTRRIEAVTGEGAIEHIRNLRAQMAKIAQSLKTSVADVPDRVAKLQESVKKLEKEKSQAPTSKADADKIMAGAEKAGPYQFIPYKGKALESGELRNLSDTLRSKGSQSIYLLCTENEDKIHFLLGATPDLSKKGVDVRELGKELAQLLNASCGGRPDLVQGGAPNQGQLESNWAKITSHGVQYLKTKVQA